MSTDDPLRELQHFIEEHRDERTLDALMHGWLKSQIDEGSITPEVIGALSERPWMDMASECFTPGFLSTFIAQVAGLYSAHSVLDPTCGSGLLLHEVVQQTQAEVIHGIDINADSVDLARAILGKRADVTQGDALSPDNKLLDHYDLIVGDPPLGTEIEKGTVIPGVELADRRFDHALCLWATSRLSEHGAAIVLVTPQFFFGPHTGAIKEVINKLGCRIRAAIYIPSGTLIYTRIHSYLVVIDRAEQQDIFVGQYERDEQHQGQLLSNLRERKNGARPALGRFCDLDKFKGLDALAARERLSRLVRSSGWTGIPAKEVVTNCGHMSNKRSDALAHGSQSCYLQTTGQMQASTDPDSLLGKASRPKDTLHLHLSPELADPRYMVHWFNSSQVGQATIASIARAMLIPSLAASDLMELTFYLPTLVEQRSALKGAADLQRIRAEADELESSLWDGTGQTEDIVSQIATINQMDRYEDWIESLPFPLASILWRHHAGGGSYRHRYEVLLHFFEATAAFVATIHLSAFMSIDDLWREHGKVLSEQNSKQGLSFDRPTFGSWRVMSEYLGAVCGKLISGVESDVWKRMYGTANRHVLTMLSAPELRTALQRTNKIRNDWSGHAGAIGDQVAKQVHDELMEHVNVLRGLFGRSWLGFELVQPKEATYRRSVYNVKASRLMGTRSAPFEEILCESIQPLESDELYLFDSMSGTGLRLEPFVRVVPSPEKRANACFIFNRWKRDGSRFISYHFEDESELIHASPELEASIERLHRFDAEGKA